MSPRSIVPVLCAGAVILLSAPAGAQRHRGALDVPLGSLAPAARPPIALRARYAKHWVNEDTTAWYETRAVQGSRRGSKRAGRLSRLFGAMRRNLIALTPPFPLATRSVCAAHFVGHRRG